MKRRTLKKRRHRAQRDERLRIKRMLDVSPGIRRRMYRYSSVTLMIDGVEFHEVGSLSFGSIPYRKRYTPC